MSFLSKNANMAKVENLAKSDVLFFQDQFYCQISMFISQLQEFLFGNNFNSQSLFVCDEKELGFS